MRRLLDRLARYATVSLISTTVTLTLLAVLVATRILPAGWANVVATAAGTVPSFELNRRWVWNKTGSRSFLAELAPFAALSFTGLALSTLSVSVATGWASRAGFGDTGRTLVADVANVATFGSLWIAQYLILDRLLFRTATAGGALTPVPARAAAEATAAATDLQRAA